MAEITPGSNATQPRRRNKQEIDVFEIAYRVVLVVASGFGAYQTFNGFRTDLDFEGAFVFAFLVFFGLILSNWMIKTERLKNASIKFPLILFISFMFISLLANTNSFYSSFLKKDIVGQTQKNAFIEFEKGNEILLQELRKTPYMENYFEKKKRLDTEVQNLKTQITDPNNGGMGEKSLEHLLNIERNILGSSVTRLTAPQKTPDELQKYADSMESIIYDQFKNSLSNDIKKIHDLQNKIDESIKTHKTNILEQKWSKQETDAMDYDLKSLEKESEILTQKNIELPSINTSADEIGSITYTVNNFIDGINVSAIFLALFFSIILDIVPLGFTFWLSRQKEQ